ncbi:suppressor protein SRP40 [Raphanus sativus]|uniref:Suppressor protein SRP40 n=1 Tax=Raphanus sativus TaxID=3726 RepID=A0A6J0MI95_RAPSA|nr:suppressor protein SRP40 [Raphanus sativus]
MGKSSSSSKKLKRSKEDPSKLRSVKKKTKRIKSKKIRRIKDSSDESESDSSFYSSSSSSEDDYRREKQRRSKLSKKKKKQKRSRKKYSSSDSEDEDIRVKKRSKRKDKHVVSKKKRRKRYSSSSSTSSDDNSESSDGMRMTREKRRLDKSKDEPDDDECWQVEDDVMTDKNNSKRLKSIVVVTYNYDDGGERKNESDENMIADDQRDGEATLSSPATGGAHDSRRIGYDDSEGYNSSETSKASHQDNSLKGDDLEAILKKRALENLKRFRGETQNNRTASKEVSSVSEGEETLQTESEKIEESKECPVTKQKLCVSEGDKDLETTQVDNVKESGTGLADLPSQQSGGDTAMVKAGPEISSCTTTKRKLIRPVLRQGSLNLASKKEADGCQDAEAESINGKSCPETSLALATKNGPESIEPRKVSARSSSHTETETLDENKEESQSEQKTNDETKGESQYEQKTMTVMRGGEMVQVNYKVYIPKKTSSLGRRQLRR